MKLDDSKRVEIDNLLYRELRIAHRENLLDNALRAVIHDDTLETDADRVEWLDEIARITNQIKQIILR